VVKDRADYYSADYQWCPVFWGKNIEKKEVVSITK